MLSEARIAAVEKMAAEPSASQTLRLDKHPAVPCDDDPPASLFFVIPCF